MSDWILTLGLQNLRSQVNAAFPGRDKASDGTIGDAAHMAESASGHNPDDTAGSHPEWDGDADNLAEVRAWDMDSDLRTAGVTAQDVVDHLRALPGLSSVIRYMIYNRKIYEASNGWASRAYTGASAHTEHIHFSGARTQAADNNQTFDYRLEDLVALTDEEIVKIADTVWNRKFTSPYDSTSKFAYDFLRYATSRDTAAAAVEAKLSDDFLTLSTAVAGVDEAVVAEFSLPDLAADIAQRVLAALPDGTEVPTEQLQQAIVGALRELAAPPSA